MKIVNPSFEILDEIDGIKILKNLEKYGRLAYKSEGLITEDSYIKFINKIVHQLHHESVIEHEKITVKIICDRGISHEIVRHRIAAYTQESTRYCNYTKDKFDGNINIIHPPDLTQEQYDRREKHFAAMQELYNAEIAEGLSPQIARGVLPTCLKTEIIVTYNLREWRHFFKMRTANNAHPQIRQIAVPLLAEFKKLIPIIFDDL